MTVGQIIRPISVRANTPFRPHTVCTQMGRSTRVSREYKFPAPVNFYIQLGRSTRVPREYTFPTSMKLYIQLGRSTRVSREYTFPTTPVKLYISHTRYPLHSIGKINKGNIKLGRSTRVSKILGNINFPPPLNFTFKWEDQQRHLGHINFPPPLNFTIGKINQGT